MSRLCAMLDIEAFGNGINGLIVSIGGVWFDPHGLRLAGSEDPANTLAGTVGLPSFHMNIAIQDALDHGAEPEGDTLRWWMEQTPEARAGLFTPAPEKESLVLHRLREWCRPLRKEENTTVWSHGSNYDLRMIHAAYERHGVKLPWPFRSERDTRTLFDAVGGEVIWGESSLPKHHPVGDAIRQAGAVQDAFRRLKEVCK